MTNIPVHFGQAHYSALALGTKRAIEAFLGRDHLHKGPSGTPAKKHRITDRAARKAKARAYANARVGLDERFPNGRHAWQRKPRDIYRDAVDKLNQAAASSVKRWAGRTNCLSELAPPYGEGRIDPASVGVDLNKGFPDVRAPYYVNNLGAEWYVFVEDFANDKAAVFKGPYQAKKTANRVARTLNGG